MNRPLDRIPKILGINYCSGFPGPISVPGQVSFSRGWEGRGIQYTGQANQAAGPA